MPVMAASGHALKNVVRYLNDVPSAVICCCFAPGRGRLEVVFWVLPFDAADWRRFCSG